MNIGSGVKGLSYYISYIYIFFKKSLQPHVLSPYTLFAHQLEIALLFIRLVSSILVTISI